MPHGPLAPSIRTFALLQLLKQIRSYLDSGFGAAVGPDEGPVEAYGQQPAARMWLQNVMRPQSSREPATRAAVKAALERCSCMHLTQRRPTAPSGEVRGELPTRLGAARRGSHGRVSCVACACCLVRSVCSGILFGLSPPQRKGAASDVHPPKQAAGGSGEGGAELYAQTSRWLSAARDCSAAVDFLSDWLLHRGALVLHKGEHLVAHGPTVASDPECLFAVKKAVPPQKMSQR